MPHLFSFILAYIDPATTNFLLQLLVGGIAAIWAIMRIFGQRIKEFLGIGKKTKNQEDVKPPEQSPEI